MEETDIYVTLSDIPRPDTLIAAYEARTNPLCLGGNGCARKLSAPAASDLERVVRTLELLLLDARAKRNAAFPYISRLPPEVLCFIFELVAIEEQPRPPVSQARKGDNENGDLNDRLACWRVWEKAFEGGSLGWIRLTHVCKSWRQSLMGMAFLWSRVLGKLPSADADHELLERAGDHTILSIKNINTPFHCHVPTTIQKLTATSQCSRLGSLQLVEISHEPRLVRSLEAHCATLWNNLEVLQINYFSERNTRDPISHPVLRAPSLRAAHFEGYIVSFDSSSLKELSVNFLNQHSTKSTNTLLDVLRKNAETLETLELVEALSDDFEEEAQPFGEISFPRLQELRLIGAPTECRAFLDRAKLPASVRLDIEVYIIAGPPEGTVNEVSQEMKPLLDVILAIDQRTPLDGLTAFCPLDDDPNVLCFHLYALSLDHASTSISDGSPFSDKHPKVKLRVTNGYVYGAQLLNTTFIEISRLFIPARFVVISYGDFPYCGRGEITAALEQFSNLRVLHITDPLEYGKSVFNDQPEIPDDFPFLSLRNSTSTAHRPTHPYDGDAEPTTPSLDMLWLVQDARTSRFSCSTWCTILADQLRHTLCDDQPVYGVKPIKVLRISYLAAVLDGDERTARNAFAELADVVEWRVG